MLPKNGVVAELGVDAGSFSAQILSLNNPNKLHLIDNWGSKRYNKYKQVIVIGKFQEEISSGKVEIHIGLSTEVANEFPSDYFDWIYIDTSHSYETTKAELELYAEKVKQGGYMAGHDFIIGNWNSMIRYGVIEAVYEFCVKHDWELIYITSELNTHPSFAIRRITG